MNMKILILKCNQCNDEVLSRKRVKRTLCDKCKTKNYTKNQKKFREIARNSFVRY